MSQLGRGSREGEKTNSKLCIELVTALGNWGSVQEYWEGHPVVVCPRWGRGKYLPTGCSTSQSWWGALRLFIFLYLNYLHKQNGWEVSLQRLWCTDPVGAMKARTKRMGGEEVRWSVSYMTSLSCKDIWEMQFLLMVATSPAKTNNFCFGFGSC